MKLTRKQIAANRKKRVLKRNKAITDRFVHLYEKERLRIDDVLVRLEEEFFLAKRTIQEIISR